MKTKILSKAQIGEAAEILKNGGLVAIPTEAVYGLAANALSGDAVKKIFIAKGRPNDNPLIVHISELNEIYSLVSDFPSKARTLAQAYWPGALTMVLPKSKIIPDEVSAGLESVAIGFRAHPMAREVIKLAGVPLAAPSANTSGSPSPTKVSHVFHDLNGKIDAILDGGDCAIGVESTVISFIGDVPRLLRPGGVTKEQIEDVIGKIEVDDAVLNQVKKGQIVSSPGMKYKHYAPKANVVMIKGSRDAYIRYVNSHNAPGVLALCYEDDREDVKVPSISYGKEGEYMSQANLFFDALRKIDEMPDIKKVYARCPEPKGLGLAIYNRLIRAAGFEVVTVE